MLMFGVRVCFYISRSTLLTVFSKFYTWLRVRGTALRLAKAPEFFLLFYVRVAYFICLLWLAEMKYVCNTLRAQ